MSHLSILPTVLRDSTLLAAALEDLGLNPRPAGVLRGFADDRQPVILRVQLADGQWLGWRQQPDGSLALVGDLQRLGRSRSLQQLIGRITRCYAARLALRTASEELSGAAVQLAG
jgi:hypothetical protein